MLRSAALHAMGVTWVLLATAHAQPTPRTCGDIASALGPGYVVSTAAIPSGRFRAPDGRTYSVPAFCRAQVVAKPTESSKIVFEVWLPRSWTGRYYQHGQGGGGGRISFEDLAHFLGLGAVAAATDDGFSIEALQTSDQGRYSRHLTLFQDHPERLIDNAYRALAVTSKSAQALMHAYYGRTATHRYFEGCSGGGTYALRAAQKYPQDWDGILVGAPANNLTRYFVANAWNGRLWLNPPSRIPAEKLPAIQQAALAKCAARAHVQQGIAGDPRFCEFDPATLLCPAEETNTCLTPAQVSALRNIYNGPKNPVTGQQLYPGFPPTNEILWAGGITNDPSVASNPPSSVTSANSFFRYIFGTTDWDVSMFNFDTHIDFTESRAASGKALGVVLNAIGTDLSPIRRHGGKILMYFGWGDPALTPLEGVAYYENVAKTMGGLAATADFFRLFMVPGMGHCGMTGPGANAFGQPFSTAIRDDAAHNILRALEAWVETGRKPDRIIAAKYIHDDPSNGIAFTRPLCPYPEVSVYIGRGSVTEAANYACRTSTPH